MKVAMLGAGNVATHLSKAFINAGYPVTQVWSRNNENAIDLALKIGADSISRIEDIAEDTDIVILAVADDAISVVASKIPKVKERMVLHTSGSTDLLILNQHPKTGVLYPLQTFSKSTELDFAQIPLCIEANDEQTLAQLRRIAEKMSANVIDVNSKARITLHISAVFACNFTNYLYSIAEELLAEANLDFNLVRPLIQETAVKAMLNKPSMVQTGPAKRNDQITMAKHVDLLRNQPHLKEMYSLLSQNIVKMYNVS